MLQLKEKSARENMATHHQHNHPQPSQRIISKTSEEVVKHPETGKKQATPNNSSEVFSTGEENILQKLQDGFWQNNNKLMGKGS